ncbi:hypothetical protein BGX30_004937, partial [Mortierella sp. GBA39]
MKLDEERHYVGHTIFTLEGHKSKYEVTFFSKKGDDWDYSLNYADESGIEEEMLQADARLEEDDDLLSTIKAEIESMLATIDQKECCILNEFEQIHSVFTDMQMTAASYYLNAGDGEGIFCAERNALSGTPGGNGFAAGVQPG